uniref:Uncharacterized protein n=1 Tax=Haemonchus contortus TaxID=6289 RepID=A0A7I4XYV4_HAECO
MDSNAQNTTNETNRRTELWMHWGSQADMEVDKADTDRQEWLCTERRRAGRQTDVDTSRQMDRGKQSDKYVRVDADRQDTDGRHRHKWTDGDTDGHVHTKGRTRTDEDKHLQRRRMQRQRRTHNTDRQGQNTYLQRSLGSVLWKLLLARPGPQSPIWI